MNIDEMPAGIELDVLVAEALGYVSVASARKNPPPPGTETFVFMIVNDVPSYINGVHVWLAGGGGPGGDSKHFAPSTDIAAAFQVVDKLLDGTRVFELESWMPKKDGWQAMFKGKLNWEAARYEQLVYAYAETRPLAICRAALKLMGGK